MVKVWAPDNGYFECHRDKSALDAMHKALQLYDVQFVEACSADIALCGSVRYAYVAAETAKRFSLRSVYYCWDLYPWQMYAKRNGRYTRDATMFQEYKQILASADRVLVPSKSAAMRVEEYCYRLADTVHAPVTPWYAPCISRKSLYAVDVIRDYTGDPMNGAVEAACRAIGVGYVGLKHRVPWDEFRRIIAEAGVLVSAVNEASTGSLTLLEGYRLGKDVLISDSERNGANEYFGDRAMTFRAGDMDDLQRSILEALYDAQCKESEQREWVDETYSVANFAKGIAEALQ